MSDKGSGKFPNHLVGGAIAEYVEKERQRIEQYKNLVPSFKEPSLNLPAHEINRRMPDLKSRSETAFKAIQEEIKDFEQAYANDENRAVLGHLASFGREVIVQISTIYLRDEYFVIFGALADGTRTRLIQHYTDFSMLLTASEPFVETPKRGIGFISADNDGD